MIRRVMEILLQSYKSTQYSMRMPFDRRANDPHLDLNTYCKGAVPTALMIG